MSVELMDGFDHYGTLTASTTNLSRNINYPSVLSTVNGPTYCSTAAWDTVNLGGRCLVSKSDLKANKEFAILVKGAAIPDNGNYISLRYAIDALPVNNRTTTIIAFLNFGTPIIAYLGVNTTGAIELRNAANTVLATSTTKLTPQTFYFLEMFWDSVTTTFTLRINDLNLDKTPEIVYTNAIITPAYFFSLMPCISATGGDVGLFQFQYMDDFLLRNSTTGVNDSWMGDRRIAWYPVTGNGSLQQWTPFYNGGPAIGAYSVVGKTIPNDSTYIRANIAASAEFTIDPLPANITMISASQLVHRMWSLDATVSETDGIRTEFGDRVTAGFTPAGVVQVYNFVMEIAPSTGLALISPTVLNDSTVLVQRNAGSGANVFISQLGVLIAYSPSQPPLTRQAAWSFVLDGHRFYVLPLGPEGDWVLDTTTKQWSQFQTQGFDGLNFTNGVMWGIRIMGGDALYSNLLEMKPDAVLDDEFRTVEHIVTGGIPTRSRNSIGVANFSLTASVGDDSSISMPISLAFSDDNGVSYSREFSIPLTDIGTQQLTWNALGSFSAPGRIFRVTDYSGPVRIDGADCVLNEGFGADSGQDQEGQPRR